MALQQSIIIADESIRLFVFDEVYNFRAAEEQAIKKKLNAFGMMAKLNPLKRPKDETVNLSRKESRYEPFWYIEAQKIVDYSSQMTYEVAIHNPFVQSVQISGVDYTVSRTGDVGKIDVFGEEHCLRKIQFSQYIDGLEREVKEEYFDNLIKKYRYSPKENIETQSNNYIEPLIPQQVAIQKACAYLNSQTIHAHSVHSNEIIFEKIHLFFVPVFAFEFQWTAADKVGVIEVSGLTGEIIEDGRWYKDKFSQVLTREMLVDLSADIAGELIPGGGIAIKVAGKLADSKSRG